MLFEGSRHGIRPLASIMLPRVAANDVAGMIAGHLEGATAKTHTNPR